MNVQSRRTFLKSSSGVIASSLLTRAAAGEPKASPGGSPVNRRFESVTAIRDWAQDLFAPRGPYWDPDGVLRSGLNINTLRPFDNAWGAKQRFWRGIQEPSGKFRSAKEAWAIDWAAGITYENTWDAIGHYLEYLKARYDATQEPELIAEMRRCAQLAIDVYREDNRGVVNLQNDLRAGFFRRLFAGRHGQWPHPEILGTDQMAPLLWGLREVRELLDDKGRQGVDELVVGSLRYYIMRNFTYEYRYITVHNLDWGEHGLAYYLPALVWAYEATGDKLYLDRYEMLHQQYMYNPKQYLRRDSNRPIVWLQNAMKWSMWVPWMAKHAPNAEYYQSLFPKFVQWHTAQINSALPSGLGHCLDAFHSETKPYPEEWIGRPLAVGNPELRHCRQPPHLQMRYLSTFWRARPDEVDVSCIKKVLPLCNTPHHFPHWHDPDNIQPEFVQWLTWRLEARHILCWLTAYWRLHQLFPE